MNAPPLVCTTAQQGSPWLSVLPAAPPCSPVLQASVSPYSVTAFERAKHDHELQVSGWVGGRVRFSDGGMRRQTESVLPRLALLLPQLSALRGTPDLLAVPLHSRRASTGCTWTSGTWAWAATTAGAPLVRRSLWGTVCMQPALQPAAFAANNPGHGPPTVHGCVHYCRHSPAPVPCSA